MGVVPKLAPRRGAVFARCGRAAVAAARCTGGVRGSGASWGFESVGGSRGLRMRFVFSVSVWFPDGATIFHPAASKHILHVRRRNCNAPELHHNFGGAGGLDQGRSECRYAMACKLLSLDVATTIGSARRSASLEIRISSPS